MSFFTNANFLYNVGAAGTIILSNVKYTRKLVYSNANREKLDFTSEISENIEHKIKLRNQIRSKHWVINNKTTLYFEDRYFLCQ